MLLAAAAALAWPGVAAGGARAARTVLVLDESASARATRSDYAGWLAAEARARLEPAQARGAEPWVVRFGAEVAVLPARAGDPDPLAGPGPADGASDLAGALAAAEAILSGAGADARLEGDRLVLITDGTWTGRDPRPALARLAARGVLLELPALPPDDRSDLALAELRLPRSLEAGAPLVCELVLEALGAPLPEGASADVELELLGPTGSRRLALEGLALEPRGALHRIELGPAPAGRTEVRALARLRGGDALAANDRGAAVVRAGDVRAVAVSAGAGLDAAQRADWERWCTGLAGLPGLQLVRVEPAELRGLGDTIDAVASCGLALAEAESLGLAGFVARGGGWLAMGGYELLAGALPALAPLAPAPEDERRVVLLADGSGSMSGRPFAELSAAVLGAMEVAPASERFELWTFTDRVEARHVLGPGGPDTAGAARALLEARPPRGATDVLAALDEAAAEAPAPDVAVLVTDGRDPPERARLEVGAAAVRARLAERGTRLVVVGAGPERDLAALAVLAGEEPLRSADEGLEQVLREELGRGRWALDARPRASGAAGAGTDEDGGELAAALARALGTLEPAPLERAARARLRGGARSVLELPGGEPVLAIGTHGRGRVAALASAPVAGFGATWTAHPEWLAPVVRALARAPGDSGGPRRFDPDGSGALALQGVPKDWPPALEARWELPREAGTGADPGRVLLAVPAELPGADPLAVRVASARTLPLNPGPEPGAELALLAGPGSADPGRELARLPWIGTAGPDSEGSPSPRRLGPVPGPGGGGGGIAGEPGAGRGGGGTAGEPGAGRGGGGIAGEPGAGRGRIRGPEPAGERSAHPAGPWLAGLGLLLVALALALGWDPGREGRDGGPGMAGGGR